MIWEVGGAIIIAFVVLAIARRLRDKIAKRKHRKLRDVIDDGVSADAGELSKEQAEEYAKTVLLIQTKCKWATEFYTEEGNKERLDGMVQTCLLHAYGIEDDFYRSAALAPIVELLAMAGDDIRAKEINELITVDFMREKATSRGGA